MTTIRMRRDTKYNWERADSVLADGELGWVLDTKRAKIGDGNSRWSDLPYLSEEALEVINDHIIADIPHPVYSTIYDAINDAINTATIIINQTIDDASLDAVNQATIIIQDSINDVLNSLHAVALSGDASDLTGIIPSASLPPLAINEVFEASDETEMLSLVAERGDIVIRTDLGISYILSSDDPSVLVNWKEMVSASDVISVAGKTGIVTLDKNDVGLSNVDDVADINKPISNPQATAYGDPETDLLALYTTAKS